MSSAGWGRYRGRGKGKKSLVTSAGVITSKNSPERENFSAFPGLFLFSAAGAGLCPAVSFPSVAEFTNCSSLSWRIPAGSFVLLDRSALSYKKRSDHYVFIGGPGPGKGLHRPGRQPHRRPPGRLLPGGGRGVFSYHGGKRQRQEHPFESAGLPGPPHRRGGAAGRPVPGQDPLPADGRLPPGSSGVRVPGLQPFGGLSAFSAASSPSPI